MGILTNLIGMAQQQEDARRQEEMQRYSTIAQMPNMRPEIQEWAIDQLVNMAPKKSGLKDVGSMFKELIKGKRGGDQAGMAGFQQALASTGRPGMSAPVPAGPQVAPTNLLGGGGEGGAPQISSRFEGGSLANVLPAGQTGVPGVKPSLMLSPQEQLRLKLDEFRQTEGVRNELQAQMQDFLDERKLKAQREQDAQTQAELQRRIKLFEPYGKDAVNMAYSSLNMTPPIRESSSSVSGLVLGSDPQLQAWGRANGVQIDEAKQYHVMRDQGGKITNALEGPATGRGVGFKGAFGELAEAQAVIDEGVGGLHKYTASDIKAAKDFITKYNRPPVGIINLGEKKQTAAEIGDAIIRGDQPPILTGMGMGGAGELRRYLAKAKDPVTGQPFNLTRQMEDWQATTRFIASANSQTQLRLKQATNFAFESLNQLSSTTNPGNDLIGQLRRFVPRTKFPFLNRAALTAAAGGAFGEAAASAATQIQAQIRDLQSELATVYKGGNSPTDIGLKQAGDMLNSDWSENVLRDAIDLSRRNLRYRLNSIANSGPQTASGDVNPYYTQPVASPVETAPINRAAAAALPKPPRPGAAIPADAVQKYLDANGGDVTKARAAILKDGWTIPK